VRVRAAIGAWWRIPLRFTAEYCRLSMYVLLRLAKTVLRELPTRTFYFRALLKLRVASVEFGEENMLVYRYVQRVVVPCNRGESSGSRPLLSSVRRRRKIRKKCYDDNGRDGHVSSPMTPCSRSLYNRVGRVRWTRSPRRKSR